MEEKVLVKGVFGGKFISIILYILAVVTFGFLAMATAILIMGLISGIVLAIFGLIISAILKKRELIVTNKRVIARGAFGFRADLPIEKITDVSMRWFNGIGCASPSLRIRFHFCKNKTEIFDTIISESLQRDSKYQ